MQTKFSSAFFGLADFRVLPLEGISQAKLEMTVLARTKAGKQSIPEDGLSGPHADRLRDLFKAHREELEAFARQKVGDGPPDPSDVTQQAFTNFAALKDPDAVENPRAFLYRTVTNLILDYVRRPVNRHKVSADEMGLEKILLDADEITPEIVLLDKEVMQVVIATVRGLKQRQRRFMLLNRIHGMSYTEIARRNGTSISTAKRETEAAVDAIRRALVDLIDE